MDDLVKQNYNNTEVSYTLKNIVNTDTNTLIPGRYTGLGNAVLVTAEPEIGDIHLQTYRTIAVRDITDDVAYSYDEFDNKYSFYLITEIDPNDDEAEPDDRVVAIKR